MKILMTILVTLALEGSAGFPAAQSEEGTAAHKKLPFGTTVKVTNVANGKSVVVTVNDRMAASNPAVIDVTPRAAEELDFVKSGRTTVKLEVVK